MKGYLIFKQNLVSVFIIFVDIFSFHLPVLWKLSFTVHLTERFIDRLRTLTEKKMASNKTPVLTKSTNMEIWVVGTSNQLFIRGTYIETKFSKIWNCYSQNSQRQQNYVINVHIFVRVYITYIWAYISYICLLGSI